MLAALAAPVASSLIAAPVAGAAIRPASTIDGPSPDIGELGGVAMARDGSGGIVYLKRVGGILHVFAARFRGGSWSAPMQVDAGQPFAGSWPRIAAGNGGRLLVVWATTWALVKGRPEEELLSSLLSPGAEGFGPPRFVDPDIREGAGLEPSLAMNPAGQAYVAYRVITDPLTLATTPIPRLHAGDVEAEIRLARFNGTDTWSSLGPQNRNLSASMRAPAAGNGPEVGIADNGNGVLAWQEPELNGTARIYSRRLFGSTPGPVLPVGPTTLEGQPLGADADAFSLAVGSEAQATVALRLAGSPSTFPQNSRLLLASLPGGVSQEGSKFAAAEEIASAAPGAIGIPDASIAAGGKAGMRVAWSSPGTINIYEKHGATVEHKSQAGPTSELSPVGSVAAPEGGGTLAWPAAGEGGPALGLFQNFPSGAAQSALLGSNVGGPLISVATGQSGLGDAIAGFLQGNQAGYSIAAASTTQPPAPFSLAVPPGWVTPRKAVVQWPLPPDADGGLHYSVLVDGRARTPELTGRSAVPDPRGLGDGVHEVQVLATDGAGGETLSSTKKLRIDGNPPVASLHRVKKKLTVALKLTDTASGVRGTATRCAWGDGRHSTGGASLLHAYPHAGRYRVTVHSQDQVGNRATVGLWVQVR